ncbi:MAG: dockerin type I domain-containing protein [Phycisphaerales bacterium]|nr:dockerin type I domain-containing protein [Phycisphaerales bacterium]MCI0676094.1 dockerin type I domain-containing protein [Phycisphaerales bacterium]
MNRNVIWILGATAALGIASATHAQPTLQVTHDTTDPFLVANGLQSATIRIVGFENSQSIQGFIGTPANPWSVTTTSSEGFFNIDSVVDPNDPKSFLFEDGFYAAPAGNPTLNELTGDAARWDSGLLGNPATLGSPSNSGPGDEVGGFAFFADGSNDVNIVMVWITLNPNGVAVNASTQFPVMRITWPASHSAAVSFVLYMNTPDIDVPLSWDSASLFPTSACCLDNGTCTMLTVVGCFIAGGVFHPSFQCDSVTCPQPCLEDLNQDGQVNVNDLLALIEAWGALGGPADLSGEGVVNVFDLLALINAWGACP